MVRCPRDNKVYDVANHNQCPNKLCVSYRNAQTKVATKAAPTAASQSAVSGDEFETVGTTAKTQAAAATAKDDK